MGSRIQQAALFSVAAVGCGGILFYPHWQDLVAESYTAIAPGLAKKSAEKEKEALEERLEETRGESGDDALPGRWGLFTTASYGETERDTTAREPGYDAVITAFTAGADYRTARNMVFGGAISYGRTDSELVDRLGNIDNDAFSLAMYLGTVPTESSYLDFTVSAGNLSYESRRNILGSANEIQDVAYGEFSGYQLNAGVAGGLDWYTGPFSYGPRVGLDYNYTNVDELVETTGGANAVRVSGFDKDSLKLNLGAGATHSSNFSWGVLSTQVEVIYSHEFLDDSMTLQVTNLTTGDRSSFTTDDPDRDTVTGRISAVAVLPNGVQYFGSFEQLFAHSYLDRWAATLGVRVELD